MNGEKMKNILVTLWREDAGQDLVEYALLVVLISLAAIAAMNNLASGISDAFQNAVTNLT
jgi:Flp pilus assembly pilin Flp